MKQLTTIHKKILNTLLDRYENSKTYSGDNKVRQTFKVRVEEVCPEYIDDFADIYKIEDFERQLEQIENEGLVSVSRKKNGEIRFIEANVKLISDYYILLGRQEKRTVLSDEIRMYQKYVNEDSVLGSFCRDQYDLLKEGKSAKYQKDRAKIYIALIKGIIENRNEIYEREFSISVLGDSKSFEKSYRKTVCKILRNYGSYEEILYGEEDERASQILILESHGIIPNPGYVNFKGEAVVYFRNGDIWKLMNNTPIAFSAELLDQVSRICPKASNILTIENLTSFHRFSQKDFFCVYIAGYHSTRITHYLQKIDAAKDLTWLHFGDMDPDGFMILKNLRIKTDIEFRPYMMGISVIKKYRGYAKELTDQDIKKAHTLIDAGFYPDELRYMLENNLKLEQEAVLCL